MGEIREAQCDWSTESRGLCIEALQACQRIGFYFKSFKQGVLGSAMVFGKIRIDAGQNQIGKESDWIQTGGHYSHPGKRQRQSGLGGQQWEGGAVRGFRDIQETKWLVLGDGLVWMVRIKEVRMTSFLACVT